jgi:hypothetical protein
MLFVKIIAFSGSKTSLFHPWFFMTIVPQMHFKQCLTIGPSSFLKPFHDTLRVFISELAVLVSLS